MWLIFVFSVLALAIPSLALWTYKWRNPKCKGNLPPGSMGLPIIGETLEFFVPSKSLDIPLFVQERNQKYGTVFKTHLVGHPVVVSSDPDFNNFIFQQEGKSVQLWYMDSFSRLLGINDDEVTGYVHKYLKKLISDFFGIGKLKDKMLSEFELVVNQSLSSWTKEESVEARKSITTMIINYSAKQLFNYDSEESEANLSDLYIDMMKGIMSVPLNVPGTTFNKCLKKQRIIMKMMRSLIKEKQNDTSEARKQRNDFLDQLVEEMKSQTFLTYDIITCVMFALTSATMGTIPITLTLTLKFLNEHPLAMQELVEEHEKIIQKKEDGNCGLTWEDYKSMTFTKHVINETLRMASSFGIVRKATEDIHTKGYTIPKGWTIMAAPFSIHLDPEIYKNPLEFNPWRWEELGRNNKAKNFVPFGGGLRSCPGAEFTKVVMAIFLHVLLTKYKWNMVKEGKFTRSLMLDLGDGYYINVNKKS